ncbi:unnamed protein product [Symbiodinium sp. KB8]|nr:unnamed protein product [Symbiodinium sp. KB8]
MMEMVVMHARADVDDADAAVAADIADDDDDDEDEDEDDDDDDDDDDYDDGDEEEEDDDDDDDDDDLDDDDDDDDGGDGAGDILLIRQQVQVFKSSLIQPLYGLLLPKGLPSKLYKQSRKRALEHPCLVSWKLAVEPVAEEEEEEEEEEKDRLAREAQEHLCQQELCNLEQEAMEYKDWERGIEASALKRAYDGPGRSGKSRCVLTVEMATGSGDRPRIVRTVGLDMPLNGTPVTFTLRAEMEPVPSEVSTTLVDPEQANMSAGQGFGADTLVQDVENQPTQPGFAGQQGPCGGATGVLALMDFKEYEVLYDRWQRGELNHKEVASYYGAEVLDLMLAQEALSHEASPAVECVSSTRPGPEEEVLGMRRGEDGVWIRYGFAHFEVVYGQWKLRERTDEEISQSYGPEWVRLFRVWRTWSLQAIWHLLPRVLDVSPDTATARSGVDFHMLRPEPLPEVIRLPFFVVKDYYEEWVTGAMSDSRVVEKFGAVWLVWFRRLRDEGVDKAAARTIAAFGRGWLGRRTLLERAEAPSAEEDDASMAYSSDYEAEQSERYSYDLEDGTPSSASPVSAGTASAAPVALEESPEEVAEAAEPSPATSPGASASVSGLSARSRSERILGSRWEVCIVSELQWTIGDLRSRVAEHWGSRISSMAAAGGLQLKHKWTLEVAGLKDGDTVFATLRRPALYSSPGASAVALVHSDGSVRVWGDSEYGGDCSAVQEKLRDVQEVRVSSGACAAILANGSVVTWGDDLSGGDSGAVQEKLQDVVQLFAFRCAFAAILADGSVVSWGEAASRGDSRTIEAQLRNVQVISATRSAFAALLTDGSVVAWGDVACGGDTRHVQERLQNVRHIEASERAFAAILADGGIVTWGDAESGGDSSKVQHSLKAVLRLKASDAAFAALLANGRVVTWGDPGCGGDSSAVFDSLEDVQHIEVSSRAFAAVRADGSVVTWGDAMFGGDSSGVQQQLTKVQQVQASRAAFGALLADGGVVTWGSPWPWFGSRSAAVREHLQDVMQIQAFRLGFAALRSDGQVVIWGAGNPCIGDLPREEFRQFASTRRACLRAAGPADEHGSAAQVCYTIGASKLKFSEKPRMGAAVVVGRTTDALLDMELFEAGSLDAAAARGLTDALAGAERKLAKAFGFDDQEVETRDAYTLSNARFWEDYYNSTDLAAFDWYGSWDTEASWLEDQSTERLGAAGIDLGCFSFTSIIALSGIQTQVLHRYLYPLATILVLGCGRSDLSERMYRAG